MSLTLLWISVACYAIVAGSLAFKIILLRRRRVSVLVETSVRQVIDHKVDSLAFHLVVIGRDLVHHGYLYFLVMGQKTALIIKYLAHKLEKRFGKVIDSVKGKQELSKQGDASHFLREIKNHQDRIRSQSIM